ncbi:glycosyltransferase [Desulforamulus aeronauticus]|uniref:Pentatricopeptide repeat domain-containing protein (PPR motif) n=1 Tax=Desulforamulus aeronauticus DSM 10349 TaxID=1121421 RepID=A0A1M6VL83_9FIRM|nr:glycosyltransferase [Desulforamulus aeronauticus]SHK82219.1 pentatricopeptide repeat domain-containing protein (PPR motif) [Desulforamulus aeronauticus DSM 10349]
MISLCMIVKNEARNLARCLNSAKDCVDEIIVVDTGSEDNTIAIAEQFGAKIFHYQWQEDFAAARNYSLDQATGDWVLYLDADEELEANCSERLRSLTQRPDIEAYIFQIINLTDGNDPLKHVNVRMFRNKPSYRFAGKLHEQIISAIPPQATGNPVVNCGISILHYGYLTAEFLAKNKAQRNHKINTKLVAEDPNNPFYLYSLGGSCVNLNDPEGAVAHYHKALQHVNLRAMYAPSIFVSLISCLLKMGRLDEAVEYLEQCKIHYPDYVDIHFIEGELFYQLGNSKRAKGCFTRCLELGEQNKGRYTSRTGVGSFLANAKLAEIYQREGAYKKALQHQIQVIKGKNSDMKHYIQLAHILKDSLKDGQQVYAVLRSNIRHSNKATEQLMLSRMLYEIEEYEMASQLLDNLPGERPDLAQYKSRALLKTGRFAEAYEVLKQIPDLGLQQTILQELVFSLWTSSPAKDASPYLTISSGLDEELLKYLQTINDIVMNRPPAYEINHHNYYFNEIVNGLLAQKSFALVIKLLNSCDLHSVESQIPFLVAEPEHDDRFELAARLTLGDMGKGHQDSDHYYALARYFYRNHEYTSAQSVILQALEIMPSQIRYQELLQKIYLQQTLIMVQEALKHYPENPEFNRRLLELQMKLRKNTPLKGVH